MTTPFDTPASLVVPATDAQIISALIPMLAERDWHIVADTQPKFVSRAAVLNTVIRWATQPMDDATPAEVSRAIHNTVGRLASHGEKANAILAYLASNTDAPQLEAPAEYAPLTKEGASKLISWLSTLPRKDRVERVVASAAADAPAPTHDVPAGRYAVATEAGAVNELAFYKVDHGKGKWAGQVFVKLMVSDDERNLSKAAADAVLAKIAADPEAAMAAYGHSIGECGMCGRTLTNDESRKRGIGPICLSKAGW